MRRLIASVALVALLGAVAPVAAQTEATQSKTTQNEPPSLETAAKRARDAWFGHDARALVSASPRLLVQLPGADPSAALGQEQAVALIADYLAPGQEVETKVLAAREVESGRGYVELRRKFRVAGTQEVRVESLLLSYRLGKKGWTLVELRVVR